jgi:hypothetical protein
MAFSPNSESVPAATAKGRCVDFDLYYISSSVRGIAKV